MFFEILLPRRESGKCARQRKNNYFRVKGNVCAGEGKAAGVNYTLCEQRFIGRFREMQRDSPTPAFLPFTLAALPCSSPVDRVGVVLTTQYYHYTKLARNHVTTDAWTRNAWNEIRSRTDREVRGKVVHRSTMKKISVDDGRGATRPRTGRLNLGKLRWR